MGTARGTAFSRPMVSLYGFGASFQIMLIAYAYVHFDTVIARTMPDDAFYYLKIAQNISSGQGSVFSSGAPTNGYHPLWMAVLVVIHFLTRPSRELFVLESLLIATAVNVVAAALLHRLLSAVGFSSTQSAFGALLYLILPWAVNLTLTGLETPLYFACLFGFLLAAQRCFDVRARLPMGHGLVLGFAAGLLMLARTDGLFFTAPIFVAILCTRTSWSALILAGSIASAFLLPWVTWNLATFGSVEQSSAYAMTLYIQSALPPWTTGLYWESRLHDLTYVLYMASVPIFYPHPTYWPLTTHFERDVLIVGGALVLLTLWQTLRGEWIMPLSILVPAVLVTIYYNSVRLYVQVWNISPVFLVLILLLVNLVPRSRRVPSVAWMAVVVPIVSLTVYTRSYGYYYWQSGSISLARTAYADSPRTLTLCSTDAGVLGYFSRHRVVNTDGVVNNEVIDYIKAGRWSDYIAAQGCDVVGIAPERRSFYDRNMNR